MSSLLNVLQNASNALDVFQRQIGVTQDNVVNASTPGYVKQQLSTNAIPIQPNAGLYGGVQAGGIESARSQFAESSVRDAFTQSGFQSERASTLSNISKNFDVTGTSGLSSAISNLFSAFSSWSESPTDSTQRQNVITAAKQFADSANQAASQFSINETQLRQAASSQVAAINQFALQIRDINASNQSTPGAATSNDAELNSALEQLSEYANFTTLTASDGTTTVLLDGQTPLVSGSDYYPISLTLGSSAAPMNSPSTLEIRDSAGTVITPQITSGKLGADLSVANSDLASILGDSTQPGSLNTLVTKLTTAVNTLLKSGQYTDPATGVATAGVALFTEPVPTDANAAADVTVNAACTPDHLAAIQPAVAGPPATAAVSNGIANQLAALATNTSTMPSGQSFVDYYGNQAAAVGTSTNAAQTASTRDAQVLSQARSLRTQISGVSLDEEAASLVQIQQSYEASSRVFSAVNQLLSDLMSALAPV